MIFSLHKWTVFKSSQVTHIQIPNIQTLARILGICALIFSNPNCIRLWHPTSPGDKPPEWRRAVWKTQEMSKHCHVKLNHLHMHQGSPFISIFRHCRAASTVNPQLTKATYTPSMQPNLGLPRTRPPLTSAINTLLTIRYSSTISTYPNQLITFWSALLANCLSIPALLWSYSFLTLSIRDTPTNLLKHLITRTLTFLLSALLIKHASAVYTIVYSYHNHACYFGYVKFHAPNWQNASARELDLLIFFKCTRYL